MISSQECASLLGREPRFDDCMCSLQALAHLPKGVLSETKKAIAYARRFNDEVVRPRALDLDRLTHADPGYLPWDLVEKANEWGFYTMFIPRVFGGQGINMPASSYVIEELSSACVGIANVAFVHYLGVAGILASWNFPLANRIFREVAEGQKTGRPCLISLAITEPGAGTDVEEVELLDRARLGCHARRVKGGYIVNGSKIFISMGHVSTWCCLIAYTDLKRPSENTVSLAVRTGTKGFSFGKHEDKMGQRVCPASELIFEDCFIPDENVLCDTSELTWKTTRTIPQLVEQYIQYAVEVTRPGVCAFATGVARGAFEDALRFASDTVVNGEKLINQEWVQARLAEMYRNVVTGRLAYAEANYANSLPGGIYHILQFKPLYYYLKYVPQAVLDRFVTPLFGLDIVKKLLVRLYVDGQSMEDQRRCSGWASLAKFTGTDIGMKNCQIALEIMGQAGIRHERGTEKRLRDAKLLQIYEGTNELNRINLFATLIGRSIPGVRVFEEGEQGGRHVG
ncbi:MAG TPA: acyl-CoA dehydrogenase family protein [Deltaproteobacteria bacterium]|nr:acyl-CoA dehydrogenase family protein [Deltaproteobacteria bacterium]HOI05734.1 acyl-CoA dehydrogenase family protein [Deltaproteobacteria bacterium]